MAFIVGKFDAWLFVPEARLMDINSSIDPLAWWEMHYMYVQFPTIVKLAWKHLAIPAPSERVFSQAPAMEPPPTIFGDMMCHVETQCLVNYWYLRSCTAYTYMFHLMLCFAL